jgi:hypothetical protein
MKGLIILAFLGFLFVSQSEAQVVKARTKTGAFQSAVQSVQDSLAADSTNEKTSKSVQTRVIGSVLRVAREKYGRINKGSNDGLSDGMAFRLYRHTDIEEAEMEYIGTVKIFKASANISAIEVVSLKQGFNLKVGDLVVSEE